MPVRVTYAPLHWGAAAAAGGDAPYEVDRGRRKEKQGDTELWINTKKGMSIDVACECACFSVDWLLVLWLWLFGRGRGRRHTDESKQTKNERKERGRSEVGVAEKLVRLHARKSW